jgi:PAS domain S-box-containing protein
MSKGLVLVVDDDESIAEYVETALKLDGYEVETALTATQALGKIKSAPGKFPVVLSDIMMPGVNGLELLKFIRQASPDTIVVMMTAHSSLDTAIQALNEGAFGYLRKPVTPEDLSTTVANAFAKFSVSARNRELVAALSVEKEYNETVLQNLVYTVVATDAAGNIRKVNKAMEDLLGYTEAQLIGASLGKILSPANTKAQWENVGTKTVSGMQLIFRTSKGLDVPVAFTGTIMRDESGAIVGFLGTAQPVNKGAENA